MNKLVRKTIATAVTAGSLMLGSFHAMANDNISEQKLDNVKRDIKLMSTILETSLKDKVGRHMGSIKGSYLAHQGILFEVNTNASFGIRHLFVNDGSSMVTVNLDAPVVIAPPLPEKPPKAPKPSFEEDIERLVEIRLGTENTEQFIQMSERDLEEIEHEFHRANVLASSLEGVSPELKRELVEKRKEISMKQRELSRQASKIEREVRKVERKMRDAEFASELGSEKSDAKVSQLEAEMKNLSDELMKVNDKLLAHQSEIKAVADKAKAEVAKKQKEIAKTMAFAISELVCDFGGGLKTLKDDKFMTFFVNDASKLYYVYKQADIEKCNDGKINYRQLLDKAIKYSL